MDLTFFSDNNIIEAGRQFFSDTLQINLAPVSRTTIDFRKFLKDYLTDENILRKVKDARIIGLVNDLSLKGDTAETNTDEILENPTDDYDLLVVFGIEIENEFSFTKTDITRLTRALNRWAASRPVVVLFRHGDFLSFSAAERGQYKRTGMKGEKIGRISILRDINLNKDKTHAGHERILLQLEINPLKVSTFKELYEQWQEVFNISILNKAFYNELFTWYLWAIRKVSFPNRLDDDDDDTVYNAENVIRLLTRLIFVWFVKEKGLVPEKLFDKSKISGVLKKFNPDSEDNSDYYKAILQNLFFATLNTEMPKDGGKREFLDDKNRNQKTGYTDEYMDHLAYRYKELFVDQVAALKLFETIPFLNGGLFECLDRKDPETKAEVRVDGFSTKKHKQPTVPNVLFFGKNDDLDLSDEFESGKRHQHTKVRGLISILNSYKFTIEENTPLEQEIALDPELLGKIFENLLASYNPETRTTARKQTGSYYTPREIVNYMVDESLIAYLKTKLMQDEEVVVAMGSKQTSLLGNENRKQLTLEEKTGSGSDTETETRLESKLRDLFAYEIEENPFAKDQRVTKAIITHLSECKILDPACGSGAFPMGILHKIVLALGKLDPNNRSWKQAQLEKAQRDKQRALEFEDETLRQTALQSAEDKIQYIEESFGRTGHELDYTRKLFLIENCIYGVDIQQIAVQISKLRFFISLMVDQTVDESKPNRNILSLPNLETKFVAANTLIPLEEPQQVSIISMDENVKKLKNELHEIRQRIFFTRKYSEKKKLKREERAKRKHLKQALIDSQFPEDTAGQISSWDPFDPLHSAPFFDPEVMFAIEGDGQGGFFDVVIGNPPYVEHKKLKYISLKLKRYFKVYSGTADLYVYFYEQAINSLKLKGTCTLITSNKFIKTEYGKNLREFLAANFLKEIIDFTDIHVFDALVASCVVIVSKEKNKIHNVVFAACNDTTFNIGLSEYINRNKLIINNKNLERELWLFENDEKQSLKLKVEGQGKLLKNIETIEICRGVTTGYNPAFIINSEDRIKLIKSDKSSKDIIKPLLKGRNIRKWHYGFNDEYLIFTRRGIDIDNYLAVLKHLETFYEELKPRDEGDEKGRKSGNYEWFEIQDNTAYYKEFEQKEKIIWGLTADKWAFAYDNGQHYLPSNGYILTSKKIPVKYILSILNSSLMKYYFDFIGIMTAGGAFTLKHGTILEFPLVEIDKPELFIQKVNTILANKNNTILINEIENIIDLMVFKLYTLTYDECQIIDPEIGKLISREDYERMGVEELAEWDIK